mgnify:CR=1 FL=1
MAIKTLDEYLATIPNDDNRARMAEALNWLFAFWGVGVVLAWGRGLPDD